MIALLLAQGFEEVEAVTPVDFLRRAGIDVRLVGIEELMIKGTHGIVFKADMHLTELPDEVEGIIIPGGLKGAENLAASEKVLKLIREMNAKGKLVAGICASPALVLMRAGVLAGKKVTCYPGFENKLEGCRFSEERVVVDGNIITSRGPGTAAEFSIKLIELLKGKDAAEAIHQATLQKT